MALVFGQMASSVEVKARWAYSELSSSRVGKVYRQHALGGVDRLADQGADFDQLSGAQRQLLAHLAQVVRTNLANAVDMHHTYVLDAWSKGRLCQAFAISHFNTPSQRSNFPFLDFLNHTRDTGPAGTREDVDPRVVADKLPGGGAAVPEWGGIAISNFPNLLVDGYLRCVMFMRDAPDSALLPIWVGLGTMGWRAEAQPMAGAAATQ